MLLNIIEKFQPSSGFLAPDNFEGGVRTAAEIFNFSISVVLLIVFFAFSLLLLRYPLRYFYHIYRFRFALKGMQWYEVQYTGVSNADEVKRSIEQMHNMKNILDSTMGKKGIGYYFDRPTTTFLIRVSPDDSVHMYIGMGNNSKDAERNINAWAAGANCSVEEVDFEDIDFVSGKPAIAVASGYDTASFTREPQNGMVGSVMSALQETVSGNNAGTIMITLEPMRTQEEDMFKKFLQNDAIGSFGDSAAMSGVPRSSETFANLSPQRGVIQAFSDNRDYDVSYGLLGTVVRNMSSLGVRVNQMSPGSQLRKESIYSIIPSAVLFIGAYFGYFSWIIAGIGAVLVVSGLLGLPYLSSFWISKCAETGAAAVPAFFRHSPRRIFKESMTQKKIRQEEEHNSGYRNHARAVAEPSCAEVIPLYQTSMMQFASMPMKGSGTGNIASSAVPQIQMSKSVTKSIKDLIDTDDVIYLGTSAKSYEAVFRTINDINYGIAFGGEAGSGKTWALISDFVGMSRLSRSTKGQAKDLFINPIWFESKADNIKESVVSPVKEYKPLVIDLHNQNYKARLALEGPRLGDKKKKSDEVVGVKEVLKNKGSFISAMEAVLGSGSFGPRSKSVADAALTIALLVNREELEAMGQLDRRIENPDRPNIIRLMYLLIGGDSSMDMQEVLKKFAQGHAKNLSSDGQKEILAKEGKEGVERIKELMGALNSLINLMKVSEATAPLLNKLPVFYESRGLFETLTEDGKPRKEFSLRDLYTRGGPVILDMTPGGTLNESSAGTFTMMVNYMMYQSITENCSGWAAKGRYIPIYADEATSFVGRADAESVGKCANVISVAKDKGRSYGVSYNVGFQSFSQLPRDARASVRSMASLIMLKFRDPDDREEALRIVGNSTMYTEENFNYFPVGIGVAKMRIDGGEPQPFTLKTPHLEKWIEALRTQGTIGDAVDEIREEEIAAMKEARKKKVEMSRVERENSNTDIIYGKNRDDEAPFNDDSPFDDPDLGSGDDYLTW